MPKIVRFGGSLT